MTAPTTITDRGWLLATLDEAGRRLRLASDAGSVNPDLTWTDEANVTVHVQSSGGGVTLTGTPEGGKDSVGPLRIPAGWTEA